MTTITSPRLPAINNVFSQAIVAVSNQRHLLFSFFQFALHLSLYGLTQQLGSPEMHPINQVNRSLTRLIIGDRRLDIDAGSRFGELGRF